ncbi:hypothetical protein M431DRAFT_410477 [Trichoderma harzianum CBS 226.95]|uniref:Uncharacterized protein n=1 Tax=Trichoderma harzianum CBS 226.95 TaxID=983964 RepID=A0A2T4AG06_TRIHA|nr:hypothetical protein M431DRAFT_410477 [Trichoderma harzianum CBS 226.95]PTB55848.1 hypothetical protein M431DRAFT_410477 [Trichoderma harzianum CBS 226.95]
MKTNPCALGRSVRLRWSHGEDLCTRPSSYCPAYGSFCRATFFFFFLIACLTLPELAFYPGKQNENQDFLFSERPLYFKQLFFLFAARPCVLCVCGWTLTQPIEARTKWPNNSRRQERIEAVPVFLSRNIPLATPMR